MTTPVADGELRERVLALADRWDGGVAEGRAHIMSCRAHPCPRCVLAEAAMDLRDAICAHEWVKMPNLRWDVCVQCGVERPVEAGQ